MKNTESRMKALEQKLAVDMPRFAVTFADGTVQRMDIVRLALLRVDEQGGRAKNGIARVKLLSGDPAPYAKAIEIFEVTWDGKND